MILGLMFGMASYLVSRTYCNGPVNRLVYVNDTFLRTYFTNKKISYIAIENVLVKNSVHTKKSQMVFYDIDNRQFIRDNCTYHDNLSIQEYSTIVERDIKDIINNQNITIAYAANADTGNIQLKPI